jgi:hypothetical protein
MPLKNADFIRPASLISVDAAKPLIIRKHRIICRAARAVTRIVDPANSLYSSAHEHCTAKAIAKASMRKRIIPWTNGRVIFGAFGLIAAAWLMVNTPGRVKCVAGLFSCAHLWEQRMRTHMQLMDRRNATVAPALIPRVPSYRDRTVYDPFEPSYSCHSEYRRGKSFGDGGKFVCGDAEYFHGRRKSTGDPCLVYSVGSNGDASFEADIIQSLGCEVHTFDPTGNSTEYASIAGSTGAIFHPIGVSSVPKTTQNQVTGDTVQLMPLQDIVELLGHTNRHIHILKIDCEGCEYAAFKSFWPHIKAGNIYVGQIQIELHGLNFRQVAIFFESADDAGYMLFHKERNNWGCMGYTCVEFSLIHKKEAEAILQYTFCEQNTSNEYD